MGPFLLDNDIMFVMLCVPHLCKLTGSDFQSETCITDLISSPHVPTVSIIAPPVLAIFCMADILHQLSSQPSHERKGADEKEGSVGVFRRKRKSVKWKSGCCKISWYKASMGSESVVWELNCVLSCFITILLISEGYINPGQPACFGKTQCCQS